MDEGGGIVDGYGCVAHGYSSLGLKSQSWRPLLAVAK
jgi:hypothetical protein